MEIDDMFDDEEDRAKFSQPRAIDAEVRAEAQEPAPLDESQYCPCCEDLQDRVEEIKAEAETYKTQWAISCAERDALQAKVAEQSAEIERLARGMAVYTEAFEAECQTTDTQSALIEMCEKALKTVPKIIDDNGHFDPSNAEVDEALAAIATHKKGGAE